MITDALLYIHTYYRYKRRGFPDAITGAAIVCFHIVVVLFTVTAAATAIFIMVFELLFAGVGKWQTVSAYQCVSTFDCRLERHLRHTTRPNNTVGSTQFCLWSTVPCALTLLCDNLQLRQYFYTFMLMILWCSNKKKITT